MDAYTAPLDPETEMLCTLHLFANIENSDEILRKLINGELCCCVIKAALIADPFQVLVAANRAAINAKMNRLTTKSLYTEVLFNLSISKNISRSLMEFGITDNDKNILVALIHKINDDESTSKLVTDRIKGDNMPISRLPEFTDLDLIRKTYKIDKDESTVSNLTNSIVSRISCKDFISLK